MMKFSGIQKYTLLDYPDHVAAIVFTPGCNMRCRFCHNKEFVLPHELKKIAPSFIDEEAILSFLEKRKGMLDGVVISGGEPTIQKELVAFIEKVRAMGFLIKLDTNGARPDVIRELCARDLVQYIAMDIKTQWCGYKDLVGGNILEKSLKESVLHIKNSGIPYEFRTTLIEEIHTEEVLRELRKIVRGAEQYSLQNFRPANTLDPVFHNYHGMRTSRLEEIASMFAPVVQVVNIR